jgi:geranylgeranyl reductase family protein
MEVSKVPGLKDPKLSKSPEVSNHIECDVAVAGVGVAGAFTLRRLSRELKVLGIDKRERLGYPVECGEIIPVKKEMKILFPDLEDYSLFDIPKKFESNRTKIMAFITPDGKEFDVDFEMHVVRRDEMISKVAEESGHEIIRLARIVDFKVRNDESELILKDGRIIKAEVVVGCDGANSRIARKVGAKRARVVPAKQYVMKNVDCDEDTIYMYVGKQIAAGGYAWIIPKGDGVANVGIGFVRSAANPGDNINRALERFVKEYPYSSRFLRSAEVVGEIGAVVPVDLPLERAVYGNTILAGDSASMIISHVGAGIPPSMVAGDIVGKIINEAFESGDLNVLNKFDIEWKKAMFGVIRDSHFIKTLWDRISGSDERLCRYFKFINNKDMWNILHSKTPLKLKIAPLFVPLLNKFL